MGKFSEKHKEQFQELMGYLVFAHSPPNDRYNRLKELTNDTESIAKEFLLVYYEHNGIANFDSL